ncbi:MAG: hypothetical protein A2W31_06885 [Planctomycetes bacterium RBG_16_64_10]|nr:MAG: hypothetical protein A2W31_06885 [Planctomycetes bacterium RBG_16_64_10]
MTEDEKRTVRELGDALVWATASLSTVLHAEGKIPPEPHMLPVAVTDEDRAEAWNMAIVIRAEVIGILKKGSPHYVLLADCGMDWDHDPCI